MKVVWQAFKWGHLAAVTDIIHHMPSFVGSAQFFFFIHINHFIFPPHGLLVIMIDIIVNGFGLTSGSESSLLGLPVLEPLSLNTPSDGSPLMRWRNNRGSKWRKTFVKPVRSWKERWKMPIMSIKQTCSDRVRIVSAELVYLFGLFAILKK